MADTVLLIGFVFLVAWGIGYLHGYLGRVIEECRVHLRVLDTHRVPSVDDALRGDFLAGWRRGIAAFYESSEALAPDFPPLITATFTKLNLYQRLRAVREPGSRK